MFKSSGFKYRMINMQRLAFKQTQKYTIKHSHFRSIVVTRGFDVFCECFSSCLVHLSMKFMHLINIKKSTTGFI